MPGVFGFWTRLPPRSTSPSESTPCRVVGTLWSSARALWLYASASWLPGYHSAHSRSESTRRTITSLRGSGSSIAGPRTVRIAPVSRFMT